MSIKERVGAWLRMERRSTLARPDTWMFEAWGGGPAASGVSVTPDTAMRSTAVYACVRLLSETIASLPLHLYRRLPDGGKERATDHPLYSLLHSQPNALMSSADAFEMLVASLNLRGPGYVQIVRNGAGEVVELIPLHPDRVRVYPAKDGRSLLYEVDGGKATLRTGEVWHIRGFTLDGLTSVSPITYNREAIGLALAAEAHGAHTFANAARPSGILSHPGKLSDEARKRLAAGWQAMGSGKQVGGAAVLEEGVTWTPLTMSAEDAQYIETRKFQLGEIARIFRVPPHMIGDLERATFSNIEHQSINFVRHTIRPWLVKIEQSIKRDLLLPSERDTYFAEFSVDGLLRGDTLSRYQVHQIAIQSGMRSPNEARAIENENPRDGGDVYLTPLNMAPSGTDVTPAKGDDDAA